MAENQGHVDVIQTLSVRLMTPNGRSALTLVVGFIVVAAIVNLGANAIHPTLRMLSIPATIVVGVVVLLVMWHRASRP